MLNTPLDAMYSAAAQKVRGKRRVQRRRRFNTRGCRSGWHHRHYLGLLGCRKNQRALAQRRLQAQGSFSAVSVLASWLAAHGAHRLRSKQHDKGWPGKSGKGWVGGRCDRNDNQDGRDAW